MSVLWFEAALNSSTVDCLGPHWWRLGRSARQPRVSKWFHLNMHIIVYIDIYIYRCTYLNHLNHPWLLTLGFTHPSLMPISKELFGYRLGRWSLMIAIDIIYLFFLRWVEITHHAVSIVINLNSIIRSCFRSYQTCPCRRISEIPNFAADVNM
jgi:hypothetical protein